MRRLRRLEFWCIALGLVGIGFVLMAEDVIGAGGWPAETIYLNLGPDDFLRSLMFPVGIVSSLLIVFGIVLSVFLRKTKNAL